MVYVFVFISKNYLFKDCLIYETRNFTVYQDWEVPVPGFLVIGAKKKIDSILEFSNEEYKEFSELILLCRKKLKEILGIEKVYFFNSEDSETGFHYLLYPRYGWMNKFGKKLKSMKPSMDYAEMKMINYEKIQEVRKVAEKLKKAFY